MIANPKRPERQDTTVPLRREDKARLEAVRASLGYVPYWSLMQMLIDDFVKARGIELPKQTTQAAPRR